MQNSEFMIDGIDTAAGIKRFGGKAEIYKKSLIKFSTQYQNAETPTSGDELKAFAHQIKGVSANLGIDGLAEIAALTEKAPENADAFISKLRDVCELIHTVVGDTTGGVGQKKTEKGTAAEFSALISDLRSALQICNPKSSEMIIDKLERTEWENVKSFDIRSVKTSVDNYDFDGALAKIADL